MSNETELYLQRAENELITAKILFDNASLFFKSINKVLRK